MARTVFGVELDGRSSYSYRRQPLFSAPTITTTNLFELVVHSVFGVELDDAHCFTGCMVSRLPRPFSGTDTRPLPVSSRCLLGWPLPVCAFALCPFYTYPIHVEISIDKSGQSTSFPQRLLLLLLFKVRRIRVSDKSGYRDKNKNKEDRKNWNVRQLQPLLCSVDPRVEFNPSRVAVDDDVRCVLPLHYRRVSEGADGLFSVFRVGASVEAAEVVIKMGFLQCQRVKSTAIATLRFKGLAPRALGWRVHPEFARNSGFEATKMDWGIDDTYAGKETQLARVLEDSHFSRLEFGGPQRHDGEDHDTVRCRILILLRRETRATTSKPFRR